MRKTLTALALMLAMPATAQDLVTYEAEGGFDDVAFALENAIISRGLVVDHVSHVGEMLARTGADVGASEDLFVAADVYQFCSATLSRKVMEADPLNIVHCPYGVFVADSGDGVSVGYRVYPDGAMQEVQALLDGIAREAAEGF